MKQEEWGELVRDINSDIASLSHAIQTQGDVRSEIQARAAKPNEEYFIDEDVYSLKPSDPVERKCYGAMLKVWKIHRGGLLCRDIKGADLYYEISDKKFVLIQYKSPNKRNRIALDRDQLDELKNACPMRCPPTNRFGCGSWYKIRSKDDREYFTACEALKLFGGRKSRLRKYFVNGLSHDRFESDFGSCRIGARTKPIDIDDYLSWSINNDHVFVSATRTEN